MTFDWKEEEIKKRLLSLLDRLVKIAMEDDVISPDEQAIIDTIRDRILSFEKEFSKMNGKHTELDDVTYKTKDLFESAIEAAATEARKDGTITSDELILIDRLAKTLRQEDISQYLQ